MYIGVRDFGSGNFDYFLQIKPKTLLTCINLFTKSKAIQKGKELAKKFNIEFKEKIHKI